MAVELGSSKFGFSMKILPTGSTTAKTKSVDYVNLTVNPTSQEAEADAQKIYTFASEINRGIIGGSLENVYKTTNTEIIQVGG